MLKTIFWLKFLMWLGFAMFFAGYFMQLGAIDHTNTRSGVVLFFVGIGGMAVGFALLLWMKHLIDQRKAAVSLDRLLK